MKAKRIVKFILIALIAIPLFGFVVMQLWNWLIPPIFGWHTIGFFQALGLFLLSKILFGGAMRGGAPSRHWRNRMIERWEAMTPEEREKFREGMKVRC